MEETDIIVEQPLSPQGHIPSPFAPESCHSPPLSDEEQEDDEPANEAGWETVDEDDELPALPARSGSGDSRRFTDDALLPHVPSLTFSTSTTTSSLPNLSPTRAEPRGEQRAAAAGGRRNLSRDSGRYDDVIHERDEDGPLTPIDGEEELLKPRMTRKSEFHLQRTMHVQKEPT